MRTWMLRLAIVAVSPTLAMPMTAQPKDLQAKVKEVFLQKLAQQEVAATKGADDFRKGFSTDTELRQDIKNKQIADYREMVWTAWREANHDFKEDKLIAPHALKAKEHGAWHLPAALEPNATMPFYFGSKKDAQSPAPLFVYLHGSGPKAQEWEVTWQWAQIFDDAPSLYFVPQIPNEGGYYRWWQLSKQYAWEKLFRQALAYGVADANRLYVLGVSEGGYGSQRLASFYADYWAAAGPMAGGEPLKNAPADNCANIGFSFLTGADDMGFYRNVLTSYTQAMFDSLQLAHPLSADKQPLFRHRINLVPGKQHHIDYRPTTPWLKQFCRNPYPKTVLWEDFDMDGRHRSGFYNLQVLARPSDNRTNYEMNINGNHVDLRISDVKYTTVQKDPQWGIEMKFHRDYSEATGGKVRLYLCEQLVDLSKPVEITINGKKVFRGKVKASLQSMVSSCAEYFDPCRVYPAYIDLAY